MLRLAVDLVPRTAWWSNVRSNVSRSEWARCKDYSKSNTNGVCVICGDTSRNQGRKYDTEAHEIWAYDDDRHIQTLVDIVAICTRCHQCKHYGRSERVMQSAELAKVRQHFMSVNGWSEAQLDAYLNVEFKIWAMRSNVEWELDISFLEKKLGITNTIAKARSNNEGTT